MMRRLLILVAVLAVVADRWADCASDRDEMIRPGHPSNWPGVTKDVHAKHVFATGDIAEPMRITWHYRRAHPEALQAQQNKRGGMTT